MMIEELMNKLYDLVDSGRVNQSAEIKIRVSDCHINEIDVDVFSIHCREVDDFIINDHASSYNTLILEGT